MVLPNFTNFYFPMRCCYYGHVERKDAQHNLKSSVMQQT